MTFPQKKSKDFKRAKKEKRGVGQGAQDAKGSLAIRVTQPEDGGGGNCRSDHQSSSSVAGDL